MASASYPKHKIQTFLKSHNYDELGERNGKEVWISKDEITLIQLPLNNGSVPWEAFHDMAIDQMQVSEWEFDYWVGRN